jgi:hypothetical protein
MITMRIPGNEIMISTILIINESRIPPINPAKSPRNTPIDIDKIITKKPTIKEENIPYITAEITSLPRSSVPKGN